VPSLQMGKVVHNFRRGPVLGSDELTSDLAAAIDHISLGRARGSVKSIAMLLCITNGKEADPIVSKKLPVGAVIFAHVHAQHDKLWHLLL
jgi:hypothetical protein